MVLPSELGVGKGSEGPHQRTRDVAAIVGLPTCTTMSWVSITFWQSTPPEGSCYHYASGLRPVFRSRAYPEQCSHTLITFTWTLFLNETTLWEHGGTSHLGRCCSVHHAGMESSVCHCRWQERTLWNIRFKLHLRFVFGHLSKMTVCAFYHIVPA